VHEIPDSARRLQIASRVTARELRHDLRDIIRGTFSVGRGPNRIALCDFGNLSAKSAAADLVAPPAEMRGRQ
jgi:hypothetical protein